MVHLLRVRRSVFLPLLLALAGVLLILGGAASAEDKGGDAAGNTLLAVSADQEGRLPVVRITTEKPVGYRYTVYDSQDPRRVIVDFRDMGVADIKPSIPVGIAPVGEVKVSSFDLTSGRLARVEILLTQKSDYRVELEGNDFTLFLKPAGEAVAQIVAPKKPEEAPQVRAAEPQALPGPAAEKAAAAAPEPEFEAPSTAVEAKPLGVGNWLRSVDVEDSKAVLDIDGQVTKYHYFSLTGPTRLVLDVYGVQPAFTERTLVAGHGFNRVRIGAYPDKTRVVLDSETEQMPEFSVDKAGEDLVISWGEAGEIPPTPERAIEAGAPLAVKGVDFAIENGNSVVTVTLSGPPEVIEPTAEGDVVRFGVKNATISRSLRRFIDTSAFPSALRIVTPYIVQRGAFQDVLFAAELKGPVPYNLRVQGNRVQLVVESGPFAEALPAEVTEVEVAPPKPGVMPPPGRPVREEAVPVAGEAPPPAELAARPPAAVRPGAPYTGQRISLVFDNADIRNILQLIADVSGMNIIASEEVKGTLTIRLIDVPWDQALEIILDVKELGMLQTGNVIRILPKEKIRTMEQAELTAAKTKRELEPVATEVISVSYSDLGKISAAAKDLLSERGKITEDNRSKQLIVTDVPSIIAEIRRLVSILDIPERQVLIEARIVEADSTFSRDLGVNWGISRSDDPSLDLGLGGSFLLSPPSPGTATVSGLATDITFGILGVDTTVLDLRISALETSGHGKVISKPRVATLNGEQANISQGTKIPYQSVSQDGTKTEFVDAVLSLDVKPVINPDNSIILDIVATNSSPGSTVSTGAGSAPAIDTKEAKTKVLVKNGDTTVIGGIFVENEDFAEVGVPLLQHIPILGHLFKSTRKTSNRSELLIFITPRILN